MCVCAQLVKEKDTKLIAKLTGPITMLQVSCPQIVRLPSISISKTRFITACLLLENNSAQPALLKNK